MRVTVDVDDLVPSVGNDEPERGENGAGRASPTSNAAELRSSGRGRSRRRSICAGPESTRRSRRSTAISTMPAWPASTRSLIIHGMGTGAVRDAVRATAGSHPLVKSMRPGQRGEGGDGATIVEF